MKGATGMIELQIDRERFTVKPDDNTIVRIANRIHQFKGLYTIREFAEIVGEKGHAFLPAIMDGKRHGDNFKEQRVFSIDFDETLPLEEFWNRTELVGLYPTFIYKTLNCHENNDRYRAVYINDCVIKTAEAASLITEMLLYLFPEGDQNCKDRARYFLGGKGLLHYDEGARITADSVAIALKTYMTQIWGKNHTRELEKIADDIGIKIEKGVFRILVGCKEDISEEIWAAPHIIYMGEIHNSSTIYFYEKLDKGLNEEKINFYKSRKEPEQIRNKAAKDIKKCCPLFEDHYNVDLHHNLKFMLATNLKHVKGGKKLFFDGLVDHIEKWKSAWNTMGVNGYHPQSCTRGKCPYAEECKCYSLYDKLNKKITIKGKEKYIPLDEGTSLLKQYMKEAISSSYKDLFLIKAQTAIGKTYTYCQLAESRGEYEKPLLIAAPTNKLQEEVYKEIKDKDETAGRSYNLVEELKRLGFAEISEEAMALYKKGAGKKVKKHVARELRKETMHPGKAELVNEIMNSKDLFDGEKSVVTTHAMLMNLPETTLRKYEVIVDEDILLTIFNGTETISFKDLKTALKSEAISLNNKERIIQILDSQNESISYTGLIKMNDFQEDQFYKENLPIEGSIPDFLKSSTIHVDTKLQLVTYFTAKELPKVPMTIVSATLDKILYEDYFKERRVEFREVPLIKYQGKLIQYTKHSVSRQFITDNTWEKVKKCVDMVTGNPNMNLITFKSYAGKSTIYFGKTAGFNEYKGQDVCVIGTPHNVPFIYRLIGKHMRYAAEDVMNVRKVENEIYEYQIMTFGDFKMSHLQLYFLESELEQAVGRARLLRCDCKVYLFSNFPLRQAEIIQDDYLKVEDVKE